MCTVHCNIPVCISDALIPVNLEGGEVLKSTFFLATKLAKYMWDLRNECLMEEKVLVIKKFYSDRRRIHV